MANKKGRGRAKGSGVPKKVEVTTNCGFENPDNPSNVLEVDPSFEEVCETDTGMAKKSGPGPGLGRGRGRGRPKGSSVQKKVKNIINNGLDTPDTPSNVLEVDPGFEEVHEEDTGGPKKRGRGRPKGSSPRKKVKKTDSGFDIPDNPSKELEMDPAFEEVHEADTGMPKTRGQGRLKGSMVQNLESANGNLNSHNISPNILEDHSGWKESEEAGVPKKRGSGSPKSSNVQNCQEITEGNLSSHNNQSHTSSGCAEYEEAGDNIFSASLDIEENLSELSSPLPSELRNVLIPFLTSNPAMLLSTHPGHRSPAYMLLGEFLLFVGSHSLSALATDQCNKFLSLLNALSDFSFDAVWLEKLKGQIVSPPEDSPLQALSHVSAAKDCVRVEVEQLSTEAARLSKALEETEHALCESREKAKALEEEESSLRSQLDAPLKF